MAVGDARDCMTDDAAVPDACEGDFCSVKLKAGPSRMVNKCTPANLPLADAYVRTRGTKCRDEDK